MGFRFRELFWISGESEDGEQAPLPEVTVVEPEVPAPSMRGRVGSVERILAGLGDVDGVVGSLLIAPDGTLLGQSPFGLLDGETLDRVSARIGQLLAALNSEANGNVAKGGVLRFRERQLYLNPIAVGVVGVLAENRVNVPALTMALRVVAQQLDARPESPAGR
jgi:predicted regulator of Ras-like GTPase activity (Roadblock/LC7/MglB family)